MADPADPPPHLVFVPHTHWDREWYRTHEQFRLRLLRLVDSLLDLLERSPAYRCFTLDGQAVVLDDYLEVRPGAAERIAKLVGAGRLRIGPWYVLPDEWLVSGEALIRNLRVGLARCRRFGGAMEIGYVPDQFGHVGQLPQIFRGYGFADAVLWRGVGETVEQTFFTWQAPDGSRVRAAWLAQSYGNAAYLPADEAELARRVRRDAAALARRSPIPSLLLMNGNDHALPDPALPERLARAAALADPAFDWEIGGFAEYLARADGELSGELALHEGELRSGLRAPLLPGCASARMPQKVRDFENDRLLTAWLEPLSAWWQRLGGDPDLELLEHLWSVALENHPHDSICGCSVDAVHEQMETRFARVRELAGARLAEVFGALAARVAGEGDVVVAFLPGPSGASPVEVDVELPAGRLAGPLHLADAGGRRLPVAVEVLEEGAEVMAFPMPPRAVLGFLAREMPDFLGYDVVGYTCVVQDGHADVRAQLGRHGAWPERTARELTGLRARLREPDVETARLAFERLPLARLRFVDALPGWGLRALRVLPGRGPAAGIERWRDSDAHGIANGTWRLTVSGDGRLRVEHRELGWQVDDALRFVSEGDRGDEYNFDPVAGGVVVERPERVRVRFEPRSPVDVGIRVRATYRVPAALAPDRAARSERTVRLPLEWCVRLSPGVDRVDLTVELDNNARDHRLRALVRAPGAARRFEVESAFEVVERPIDPRPDPERPPAERPVGATPQRTFASLSDGERALTVANRGVAEAEGLPGGQLAVTLLRAVGWLSRDDLALRPVHAGPPFPTPGAQVPGRHRVELSFRWHREGDPERAGHAHRFARPPLAIQRGEPAAPQLRDGDVLLGEADPRLVVSAVEPSPGGATRVRVYNGSGDPVPAGPALPGAGAPGVVDLTDRPVDLEADAPLRGHEIRTLRWPPR